jgi:meso-butanediol dehydrogenase / (S,S)-butanediol dehydrogenase / diacetyl reductase
MKRFTEQIIIVTGGASGIGEVTAKEFCKEGGTVVLADYNVSEIDRVQSEIISTGGKASNVRVDLSDPTQVKEMIDFAINEYGRIDVLFNNAASQVSGSVTNLSLDQWRYTFAIMLDAPFLASKFALEKMIQQKSGVIINAVSPSGVRPDHGMAAYGACKAALINLTKSIAIDYAMNGIRCVGVAPGPTLTRSLRNFLQIGNIEPDVKERLANNMPPEILEKYRKRLFDACPTGRFAEPEEIARTVLFLASSGASYISGDVLFVDGAMTAQPGGMPRFQP